MGFLKVASQQLGENVDCIRILQRVKGGRQHGEILDELEHGNEVVWGHSLQILEDAC